MSLSYTTFAQMIPTNPNPLMWFGLFMEKYQYHELNTNNRIAAFMAQCAHESNNFTILRENLNYSAEGLKRTWPSRFKSIGFAQQYARQPEKIANYVYANRLGNGPESSGDGWAHSGKGVIQLTGKDNYIKFGERYNIPLEEVGPYLLTPEGALESAFYYWDINNLNRYADREDMIGLTKAINGGTIGLDDRIKRYLINKKLLKGV